jgi:hypothetical protein
MTRFTPLAVALMLAAAPMAMAQETTAPNAIGLIDAQNGEGSIDLRLVTADADGVLRVFNADDTAYADPLGEVVVTAGANEGVEVLLTKPLAPTGDALVVLFVDEVAVAEAVVPINRDPTDGGADSDDDNDSGDAAGDENTDASSGG